MNTCDDISVVSWRRFDTYFASIIADAADWMRRLLDVDIGAN
jgi:hypothetical protein